MATGQDFTLTEEDVDNIEDDDLEKVIDLLEEYEINYDGLDTVPELKELLKQKCREEEAAKSGLQEQETATSVMKMLIEDDKRKRGELIETCEELSRFLTNLDEQTKEEAEANIPGYESQLRQQIENLSKGDCPILVAGETSAGKSSLLNLLLGEEVLPYSHLSSTSVICELKNGHDKRVKVHMWQPGDDGRSVVEFKLTADVPYHDQLAQYVHQKGDRDLPSEVKMIEIFWPIPILQGDIFIVDSPGVGENERMTQQVMEYIPQAFAFIYVINSANAGGVQEDRLQKLLRTLIEKKSTKELRAFHPKSSIFIFNKWDQVPKKEESEVKEKMVEKLRNCWNGLDPESQVFYLSTIQAARMMKAGAGPTEDFRQLLDGFHRLVPEGLKSRLLAHYNWLEYLLKRILFFVRARLDLARATTQQKEERSRTISRRLQKFEQHSQQILGSLEEEVKRRTNVIVDKLHTYMTSPSVRETLCHWKVEETPDVHDLESLEHETQKLIQKRLEETVNAWEREHKLVKMAQEKITELFKKEFHILDDEFMEIEKTFLLSGELSNMEDINVGLIGTEMSVENNQGQFSAKEMAIIGLTAPVWIPLAIVAGVIALPILGSMAAQSKIKEWTELSKYRANRVAHMEECTKLYLNHVNTGYIHDIVVGQLSNLHNYLDQLKDAIPKLINADKKLIENLRTETREGSQLIKMYRPINSRGELLLGQLELFRAVNMKTYDVQVRELQDWDRTRPIASGSFADVYSARLHGRSVALKVTRCPLTDDNTLEVLQEEEIMRKLKHKNIVEFLGSALQMTGDSVRFIMVLELCSWTLREVFFRHPKNCPGKQTRYSAEQGTALNYASKMAAQLADGLRYIHECGYVHRDLKLENVLVTSDDVVKLCDVGLTKAVEKVTGTLCGTILYAAPEVLRQEKYTTKVDMFGFGHLLWEMWYGEQVFKYDAAELTNEQFIMSVVLNHMRPKFPENREPVYYWKDLMVQCWEADPSKRPTAEKCYTSLMSNKDASPQVHFKIDGSTKIKS
ncbi:MAP3K12 [Branchiostoma lanceolatum]|uniref:MAP3K12 protein n=1 Tax=Branchiostoma lanceolatum TaxID=7740 RepID=A0A8K0EL82_BRALA|nr:MAP3K12 [Branchiostoma lanceolatum]